MFYLLSFDQLLCFTFMFHFHFSLLCFTFMFHFHFSLSCFTFIFHFYVSLLCFTFMFHFHFSLLCFTFMFHFHVSLSCFTFMFHFYVSQNSNRYCRNEIVRSNLGIKSISPALSTVSEYVHRAEADSGNRSWSSPGSDKSTSLKKSVTHINTQNIKWGDIRSWN